MKKTFLFFGVIFLIVITTLIKNSTKKLENKIFITEENLSVLKDKYELVLLDYNYLSSPEKLMNYQSKFFDDELIEVDIREIKKINISKDNLIVEKIIN